MKVVEPIEYDKGMNREYIPLPGGWEIQTKGSGSSFRICAPEAEDGDSYPGRMPITPQPYLYEMLVAMARAANAAGVEAQNRIAALEEELAHIDRFGILPA